MILTYHFNLKHGRLDGKELYWVTEYRLSIDDDNNFIFRYQAVYIYNIANLSLYPFIVISNKTVRKLNFFLLKLKIILFVSMHIAHLLTR